jgi:ABC-type glutathione transport system ATPase component
MTSALVSIEDLHIAFGRNEAVRGISFEIGHHETFALVGESGSGKSATALAILRLIEREGGRITHGRITYRGEAPVVLTEMSDEAMQEVRGRDIAMVFQEPLTALNPVLTIGRQMTETILRHESLGQAQARRKAVAQLDRVRIPNAAARLSQYPHELSGGQRQRVMIAMALACNPRLLIADEPSTALDVTTQAEILALIRELQADQGMSVLFITHDMGVVAEMAHRVGVLRHGRLVETGPAQRVLGAPREPYSRMLVEAAPRLGAGGPQPLPETDRPAALVIDDLVVDYAGRRPHLFARRTRTRAVDGVSLRVAPGESLGLVGESGCGKSSIARAILRLTPVASGKIAIDGQDITSLSERRLFPVRRKVQMVFQDPFASLNPRLPTWDLITEPAHIHATVNPQERRDVAAALLDQVGLGPEHLDRYPHQYSGGQRQRLCIARALSVQPGLIIADEPVAALDVSIARQITDLMQALQERLGVSFLFISHDLAVVERLCHRIAVMREGKIIETGPTDAIIGDPREEYTRKLIAAVPGRIEPAAEAPPARQSLRA